MYSGGFKYKHLSVTLHWSVDSVYAVIEGGKARAVSGVHGEAETEPRNAELGNLELSIKNLDFFFILCQSNNFNG